MGEDGHLEMAYEDQHNQVEFGLDVLSEDYADDAEFECLPGCRQGDHDADCEWYDAVYG